MIYALGAFDGFHKGHARLLEKAKENASRLAAPWGVITFAPHPRRLFCKQFKTLFTPEEKDLIARRLEVPRVEKIPFTKEVSALSPENFAEYIASRFSAQGLVVGENFRFARGRAGTPEILAELAASRGWTLDVIPSYKIGGVTVSSTETRKAVSLGDLRTANELLGYPFIISGPVERGEARGRRLGYRTANIALTPDKIYPPDGAYAALSFIDDSWRFAALNVGTNPTFDDGARAARCEAHITDFDGELYSSVVRLFVVTRLRGEEKFKNARELSAQIASDVAQTRAACEKYMSENEATMEKFAKVL